MQMKFTAEDFHGVVGFMYGADAADIANKKLAEWFSDEGIGLEYELVRRLKEENALLRRVIADTDDCEIKPLKEENARFREALEKINRAHNVTNCWALSANALKGDAK